MNRRAAEDRGPGHRRHRPRATKPARRAIRCDGWRRHGNAFSFGPVTWEQCGNDAVVLLTVEQEGKIVKDSPACAVCWEESRQLGIKQIDAKPITTKRKS